MLLLRHLMNYKTDVMAKLELGLCMIHVLTVRPLLDPLQCLYLYNQNLGKHLPCHLHFYINRLSR